MNIVVFLLLLSISIGSIYIVHKYFGKNEFYLLAVMYSVIAFLMSFKIITIFGINVNCSIIFEAGIFTILYYFVNRYNVDETKRYFATVIISTLVCELFLVTTSFMIPSIYDKMSVLYNDFVVHNSAILLFYPISLTITLMLLNYAFKELKKVNEKKIIKMIATLIGIMFIDSLLFIYFSYAFIIRFDISLAITLDNYLARMFIIIIFILLAKRLLRVKKVKE